MLEGTVINYFNKQPMPHLYVSDGKNVTFTDEEGKFTLAGWEKAHFVFVGLLTECPDDWYIAVDHHVGAFDFIVKPVNVGDDFCFLHHSDTEIEGRSKNDWLDEVRDVVKKERPAFFMNTGDLCRRDGIRRHAYLMNSESVGCPVRYAVGNHDLCKDDYGERYYERYFGPSWYAFDCGRVHFVTLDIGCGDESSGYTLAEREAYLLNDLQAMGKDKCLVLFCHHFHPLPTGYGHTLKRIEELTKPYSLKCVIFGHDHFNYTYEYGDFVGMCSSRPDSGGIDSSPAGCRKVTFHGSDWTSAYMYQRKTFTAPLDTPIWQTPLHGHVGFTTPIVNGDDIYVATFDDGYPTDCGVHKLDKQTGALVAFLPTGPIKGDMALCEGRLFAVDTHGVLYCIDAQRLTAQWTVTCDISDTLYQSHGALVCDGKIIVGSTGHVYAFDFDGKLLWKHDDSGVESPSRRVYDEKYRHVICGRHWGALMALDVDTGEKVWETRETNAYVFNSSSPTLAGDVLYVAGNTHMAICNRQDGSHITDVATPANFDVTGRSAVDDDAVYVPTASAGVYAMDKKTLSVLRVFSTEPSLMHTAPYLFANVHTVENTPIIRGDDLMFGASDGFVYVYDKRTALVKRKIAVGCPVTANVVWEKDCLFVADFDGTVRRYSL